MVSGQSVGDLEPSRRLRSGAAASVAAHLAALALVLLFTNVRAYAPVESDAIAVDLVSPDEIKPPAPPPPPPPTPASIDLAARPKPEAPPQPPPQPQAPPPDAAKPAPLPKPQAAAKKPSAAPAPAPASASPAPAAEIKQAAAPLSLPPVVPQPPDITERFHVMLGLPAVGSEDGGGAAIDPAKLAAGDIDKLRARVRSCSALPASVGPTDKVRVVMRIWLTPDRRLARPPALVEASASIKGPLLMQAATKALQDCQPYSMLPADKYQDWKVLDLPFTPPDFQG